MNIKKYVGKWLEKQIKRLGPSGLIGELSRRIGLTLAKRVVKILVNKGVNAAMTVIGAKLGLLAGPACVAVWLAGWL